MSKCNRDQSKLYTESSKYALPPPATPPLSPPFLSPLLWWARAPNPSFALKFAGLKRICSFATPPLSPTVLSLTLIHTHTHTHTHTHLHVSSSVLSLTLDAG